MLDDTPTFETDQLELLQREYRIRVNTDEGEMVPFSEVVQEIEEPITAVHLGWSRVQMRFSSMMNESFMEEEVGGMISSIISSANHESTNGHGKSNREVNRIISRTSRDERKSLANAVLASSRLRAIGYLQAIEDPSFKQLELEAQIFEGLDEGPEELLATLEVYKKEHEDMYLEFLQIEQGGLIINGTISAYLTAGPEHALDFFSYLEDLDENDPQEKTLLRVIYNSFLGGTVMRDDHDHLRPVIDEVIFATPEIVERIIQTDQEGILSQWTKSIRKILEDNEVETDHLSDGELFMDNAHNATEDIKIELHSTIEGLKEDIHKRVKGLLTQNASKVFRVPTQMDLIQYDCYVKNGRFAEVVEVTEPTSKIPKHKRRGSRVTGKRNNRPTGVSEIETTKRVNRAARLLKSGDNRTPYVLEFCETDKKEADLDKLIAGALKTNKARNDTALMEDIKKSVAYLIDNPVSEGVAPAYGAGKTGFRLKIDDRPKALPAWRFQPNNALGEKMGLTSTRRDDIRIVFANYGDFVAIYRIHLDHGDYEQTLNSI